MPKELQTIVRQGRKVLANLWLKEVLTTRDTCFFFQAPSLNGETELELRQKFHHQLGMTWRHFRPSVSKHYLKDSPYRELLRLMQGPFLIAYAKEAVDRDIPTKSLLALAKEYNLGLLGAKWRNTFVTANQVKELKSEATYRGEVLALFAGAQRNVVQALNVHHEKTTGVSSTGEKGGAGAAAGKEEAAAASTPSSAAPAAAEKPPK